MASSGARLPMLAVCLACSRANMNKIYNFRDGARSLRGTETATATATELSKWGHFPRFFFCFCLPALKRISLLAGICQTRRLAGAGGRGQKQKLPKLPQFAAVATFAWPAAI